MRKLIQLSVLAIAGTMLSYSAVAQISMEGSDFLGLIGKSHSMTQAEDYDNGFAIDLGGSGANQTWDFSSLDLGQAAELFSRSYMSPAETPFADSFATANLATHVSVTSEDGDFQYFQYQYVDANGLTELGIAAVFDDTTFFDIDMEPSTIELPVGMGTTWMEGQADTTYFTETDFSVFIDSSFTEVESWGTITLPSGSFQALRIRNSDISISEIYVSNALITSDTTRTFSYDWVTKTDFVVMSVSSMDDESDPNFTTASQIQYLATITTDVAPDAGSGSSMLTALYPNPSSAEVTIEFTAATPSVDLGVYDILGRRIRTLTAAGSADVQSIQWNGVTDAGNRAAPGMYIIRLQAGDKVESRQVVLSR